MITTNNNAKFTFLYLLSLVALVFTTLSTGIIIFQIINKLVPDSLGGYGGVSQEGVKFAIAAIVVAAPVYYWIARFINKNLVEGNLDRDSATRRWLTYLILFVAAVVSLGWLIATFNIFFNGELTLRFAFKLLTVLSLTNMVFGFYFYDIKRQAILSGDKKITTFLVASLLVVVSAFTAAWFVVDSPALTRAKNQDRQTLEDFNQIDSAINSYVTENKKLPASLDQLVAEHYYLDARALKNEVNGQVYEYKPTNEQTYQLCAEFKTDNQIDNNNNNTDGFEYLNTRWSHGAGQQCLTQRVIKSDLKEAVPVKQ